MSDADRDERDAAERAAARRAFIRSAHPDRGGDPDAFIAGLRQFGDRRPDPAPERPLVYRSRRPDRVVKQVVRTVRRRLSGRPPRNLK